MLHQRHRFQARKPINVTAHHVSLAGRGGQTGGVVRVLDSLTSGYDDGSWRQVAIAVYPSVTAMMTMLARSDYRAAPVHRIAELARTRLLAIQPLAAN